MSSLHGYQATTSGEGYYRLVAQPDRGQSSFQGAHREGPGKSQRSDEQVFSLYDRFGWIATTILIVTTLILFGGIGFLWFMWMADQSNKTWHAMAAKNWLTRAVTLTSVALRTSISLQATTATSLLAGLALENTQILMQHLASVSMMRNANAGPYMLLWLIFKAFLKDAQRWRHLLLPMMILLLTVVSLLTEFTSTALLSDLKQSLLPAHTTSSTTATNFHYDENGTIPYLSRGTVWTKKPPFYPTFAEYHETPTDSQDGTSDTGLTLRAFFPIQSQQERSMLRDFSGPAAVVDSRVKCVRPRLTLSRAHYAAEPVLGLSGEVTVAPNQSTNFSSVLPYHIPRQDGTVLEEWQLGMTYLGQFSNASSAPIQSEFQQPSSSQPYGMAFLVVNVTVGTPREWMQVLGTDAGEFGQFGGTGAEPKAYRGRGEWTDILFTANGSMVVSASLCYAAYDSAVLQINAFGGELNRTEPSPVYEVKTQKFDYTNIRRQLGQTSPGTKPLTAEDRGIFSIPKRETWLPGPGDYANSSWLLQAVALTLNGDNDPTDTIDYLGASSTSNNVTAYMYYADSISNVWRGIVRFSPDPSVTALFQQILLNNGNIAFALQSVLTIFTGMNFYDQLQRFNGPNEIHTTPLIIVNRPQANRGLIAVTSVIGIHILLMGVILYLFLTRSVISTVGNAWQTLAQIMRGDLLELVKVAPLATDSTVEEKVKEEGWKKRLLGVQLNSRSGTVQLVDRVTTSGRVTIPDVTSRKRKVVGQMQKRQCKEPRGDHEFHSLAPTFRATM